MSSTPYDPILDASGVLEVLRLFVLLEPISDERDAAATVLEHAADYLLYGGQVSTYKRDDKKFRAQIARLADAGLHLDRTKHKHRCPVCHLALTCNDVKCRRAPELPTLCGSCFWAAPTVPERSKGPEIICGLVAYVALAVVVVVWVKYIILPLWRAL